MSDETNTTVDTTDSTDATAYGGRFANGTGFDPSYTNIAGQDLSKFTSGGGATIPQAPETTPVPTNLSPEAEGFLSKMFKSPDLVKMESNLQDLTQMNPTQVTPGWGEPGSLSYRWGLRVPGTPEARNFFDHETPAERDDRMGLVGQTLGTLGNAAIATMMPPTLSATLGAMRGLQEYKDTGDVKRGLGTALTALPGYFGAAGNLFKGNYGSALTGALTKGGLGAQEASLAGMGLDKYLGKDVTKPAIGLGGYFVGRSLGGPVGGVFGQNIGKSLANIYGKK